MSAIIGIRREDKSVWERRTPLIPKDAEELKKQYGIDFIVQTSKIRAFSDKLYSLAGTKIEESLANCDVILGIKEIPIPLLEPKKTYVFFSHTIKGQSHNMPMLKKLMELKCNLIDYEKIVDSKGKRLILFGRYAGIAGIIDTLWALGKRLDWENISNPFSDLKQTYKYKNLETAKEAIREVGKRIKSEGISEELVPFVIGIAGYGNVSSGVQEILNYLPVQELKPDELSAIFKSTPSSNIIYKIVFKEKHTVYSATESISVNISRRKSLLQSIEPISSTASFDIQDYYKNPEKYRSKFHIYLPYLTVFINAIYWDKRYPRLVTKEALRKLYGSVKKPRLRIIGDISCDINGAVECTACATSIDSPTFVYNPTNEQFTKGYRGEGIVIMAVDNLPCELPAESSAEFSSALKKFIPDIAKADFSVEFESCKLPKELKDAIIVYQGKLTPNYKYLEKFL